MGKHIWTIQTLERRISNMGMNDFEAEDTLKLFLEKRPKLFCVIKVHSQRIYVKRQE